MNKVFCWFSWVFLLAGDALAQKTVSLRTLQLGGGDLPESWVQVPDAEAPVKLPWLNTQPTEPLAVICEEGNLKLLRYTANAEGEMVVEVAKVIPIPATADEVLLLAWMNNGDARYVAIKDLFLNAKFNDWIAINTSNSPVAVLAGDKGRPVGVDAGKSVIFQPDIREGKGVKILAQAKRNGEAKTFLSSYWPAFSGQRTMIIFYDDGEKMRARRIGDRFLPKEEEP